MACSTRQLFEACLGARVLGWVKYLDKGSCAEMAFCRIFTSADECGAGEFIIIWTGF